MPQFLIALSFSFKNIFAFLMSTPIAFLHNNHIPIQPSYL